MIFICNYPEGRHVAATNLAVHILRITMPNCLHELLSSTNENL